MLRISTFQNKTNKKGALGRVSCIFLRMASSATKSPPVTIPPEDLRSFSEYLKSSTRILALLGAGLSASSGLPTFRGAGGLWRTHEATILATPEAFRANPGLVWQFYSYRRHMALNVKPNPAHYALAELARKKEGFLTISQNVDGLSPRAGHPDANLKLLHGSLFDVKCSEFFCDYIEHDNFTDPIVPALAIPLDESDPTTNEALQKTGTSSSSASSNKPRELDISDENVSLPELAIKDLPRCPKCKEGILRPGVVWFGEGLPPQVLDDVETWIDEGRIDLMIVIGTSSKVWPAAGYTEMARNKGARMAVINMDRGDAPKSGVRRGDWMFEGDAAQIVPELFKEVTGDISHMWAEEK